MFLLLRISAIAPSLRHLFCLLFVLFLAVPAFAMGEEKRVSFMPHWSPQAQFAGYYVAYEKGIYKKYGINARILQGGPHHIVTESLEGGEADYVSMWLSTALQKRSQGLRLLNIGQIIRRSSLMLVAKKQRGIRKPEDMNGKKVGLWGNDFLIQPQAFLKKHNLKVTIIPQTYSVNLFLRDGVDVASAMWYNEYHTILNAGLNPEELTTFSFDEWGLNFPEDGIYVLEKTYREDPALACNFVRASLEGWAYAFDHTDEALEIVIKYMTEAKVPANRTHQRWMLARMKDLMVYGNGEKGKVGLLDKEDYRRVVDELIKGGMIAGAPDFDSFFIGCAKHVQK